MLQLKISLERRIVKMMVAMVLVVAAAQRVKAELIISNVRAAQRVITEPEDAKLVDIWYDAVEIKDEMTGSIVICVSDDDGKTFSIPASTIEKSKDTLESAGKDRLITWNAGVDWNGKVSPNMRFKISELQFPPAPDDDGTDARIAEPLRQAPALLSVLPNTSGNWACSPPPGDGDGDDTSASPNQSPFSSESTLIIIDDDDDVGGAGDPTPSALSNRTFVDTRDPRGKNLNALEGVANLIDEKTENDRLISYEMTPLSLPRPANGPVVVYLQLKIPRFEDKNAGWGLVKGGLGTFYGLEIKSTIPPVSEDSIFYKIGGGPPTPNTPDDKWKLTTFDSIIKLIQEKKVTRMIEETYYFKINLSEKGNLPPRSGPGSQPYPLTVSNQYKSARFCSNKGKPVTEIDSQSPIWLVIHGKKDGEKSFRALNKAVQKGAKSQAVSLDWASGASGFVADLSNGRYFINLGESVAQMLGEQKFSSGNLNCVGHSWGTLVGYEIARSTKKKNIRFNRFCALDPATAATGGYDDERVNFSDVCSFATGVKGGTFYSGTFGSETKTQTCDLAIRLISDNGIGSPPYFHTLPRDWFEKSMVDKGNAWPLFRSKILSSRNTFMPWGSYQSQQRLLFGFDIECVGITQSKKLRFKELLYVRYNHAIGEPARATIKKDRSGLNIEDWTFNPKLK